MTEVNNQGNVAGRGNGRDGHDPDYADGIELPPVVTVKERRLQVRAHVYWLSLRGEDDVPSIEKLDLQQEGEFRPYSILLDVRDGPDNPALVYLGDAIARECGISRDIRYIHEAPAQSLLAQLGAQTGKAVGADAPIAFEAEFINQRGAEILSRGLLMPFAAASGSPDYIYAVINWKEVASEQVLAGLNAEMQAVMEQEARANISGKLFP